MDDFIDSPGEFVGERVRIKGKIDWHPRFQRDTQLVPLGSLGCFNSACKTERLDGRDLVILSLWLQLPDELELKRGDVVTVDGTINACKDRRNGTGVTIYLMEGCAGLTKTIQPVSIDRGGE